MSDTMRGDDNSMSGSRSHRRSSEEGEGGSLQPPRRRTYRSLSLPGQSPIDITRIHSVNNGAALKLAVPELPSDSSSYAFSPEIGSVLGSVRRGSALSTVSLPITGSDGTSLSKKLQQLHLKVTRRPSTSSIDSTSSVYTVKTSNTTEDQFWRSRQPSQTNNAVTHGKLSPKTLDTSIKTNKKTQYCSSLYDIAHKSPSPYGESSELDIICEEEVEVRYHSSSQDSLIHNNLDDSNREESMREKRSVEKKPTAVDDFFSIKSNSSHNNISSISEERQPSSDPEDTENKSSSVGNRRHNSPCALGGMLPYQVSKAIKPENSHNDESCSENHKDSDSDSLSYLPSFISNNATRPGNVMQWQKSLEHLRGDESIMSSADSNSSTDSSCKKKFSFICRSHSGILLVIITLSVILFFTGAIILAVGFQQRRSSASVPYESPTSPTVAPPVPTVAGLPPTAPPIPVSSGVNLLPLDELLINGNKTKEETIIDVKLANDGKVVAVLGKGSIQVFREFDGGWTQNGKDIDIPVKISNSSIPALIAISEKKGDTIALLTKETIRVFFYDSNNDVWDLKGRVKFTNTEIQVSSIALSANGSIMAVATHNFDPGTGSIQVYSYNKGNRWFEMGQKIPGYAIESGFSIDLSNDGQTLLVGSWRQSQLWRRVGIYKDHRVSAYKFINGDWQLYGPKIRPTSSSSGSTVSVSLDSTGEKFAVCTMDLCGVYAFSQLENKWNIVGWNINGGKDVRLSGDGKFMLVNSPEEDSVLVYQLASGIFYSSYSTIKTPILIGDYTGQSISISGRIIAVGLSKDDFITPNAGVVRVYKIE
eukprot:CAMPEP_0194139718 /NCGR_PEP_ID=MMETSP0152-20130528/9325_1 /TAXON_ID=1049557 /ORGANISM="Thalassiothrix antarctica, Strain L6-D1" /LENGTH=818 /DNA_ID=CAMNT_0038837659 /DNA_START=117 /DNA_END=2573 /DNA_ORIENTATION=+